MPQSHQGSFVKINISDFSVEMEPRRSPDGQKDDSWLRATDLGSGGHPGLTDPTVLERTPAHKPLKQPLTGCLMYIAAPSDLLPQAPFQSYKSDLRVKPWFR